ncbi:hypothetical protein B0I27_109109 [Arcticibacter pallidicorallinus]|uniref:Uncharacterized protein n=1 Tax=Arcticibacter pallidicorallinus TaxID=1259464 RepID=A0A2T0TXG5_9SPHI|nr:hypothetical protein [Arcticibacter pallidicorallinus]PRY50386.1 hypothetical protein B0I27_109109 [Arcticibacter pallidicorallinus]
MQIDKLLKNNWLLVALGGLGLYTLKKAADVGTAAVNGVGSAVNAVTPAADKTSSTTNSVIETLNSQTSVKKALTVAVQNQANILYGYLRGFTILPAERNKGIKAVFDAMTTTDMIKALHVAYGLRPTYDNWIMLGFKKYDMVMALKSDLSEADFKAICYPKLHKAGLV